MLKKFSVSGFMNFAKSITLDLSEVRDYRFNKEAISGQLVKCALVYGRNAVGKTNLSSALFDIQRNIYSGAHSFVEDGFELNYLNADLENDKASFEYVFLFGETELCYKYEKSSPQAILTESLLMNGTVVFDYDHRNNRMLSDSLALVGAESLNWEFFEEMSVFGYVCNNTPAKELGPLHEMYGFIRNMTRFGVGNRIPDRFFLRRFSERIIKQGCVDEVNVYLQGFGINEKLVAKEAPSGEMALYFDHKRPVPFAEYASSGTVALLRLFDYLRVRASSLLFIDEFDAFYHHDLAERVLDAFKEISSGQVVCTTHNTDLFSNKILRPDCLFVLTPESLKSAANATDRELREGHNLEKLYKAGEFDV